MSVMFNVRLTLPRKSMEKHMASIRPDLEKTVGRSSTRIEHDEDNFYIYIEAPDTVSLRAAIGSLTRWLVVVERIFEEVE